jgi:uncharacterized protein (DUF1786 family)
MRILAIDIGVGTQDIMVYDDEKGFDKAYKLVLPSPTRIFADEVRRSKEDLVIFGDTMGGGPFTRAIIEHLKTYKVYMTESAARTLRDDLESVKNYGVEIIAEDEMEELSEAAAPIKISDLNLQLLTFLPAFGVDTYFDVIAIAVQDHGVAPPGVSDRENRFGLIEDKAGSGIESFAYLDGVPENLSRMNSIYRSVKRWHEGHILLMDTGPAAVLGSLEDERVKEEKKVVCINVGNAHTIAMSLNDGQIAGVFEHHTGLLDKQKLDYYIKKLSDGTITFKEVFDDGGHGALVRGKIQPEIISVTGPRRGEMKGLGIFAAPAGDMMMTGPVGLIKAVLSRL